EPVGSHEQSIGALADKHGKGSIDLADCAGTDDLDLQPEGVSRFAHIRQCGLGVTALIGLTSTPTRMALGTRSCRSDSRLACVSRPNVWKPVAFPPGRARLATRPSLTGSRPTPKAIGIVAVAALAATAGASPSAAITATRLRTRSAITAGRRSNLPSRKWYSMVTFRPPT